MTLLVETELTRFRILHFGGFGSGLRAQGRKEQNIKLIT